MKIKILITSVIMAAVFAVTGCGTDNGQNNGENNETEKDAYTLYTDASKILDDSESVEMKSDINMSLSSQGQAIGTSKTSSTVKKVKKDDTNFDMELNINTDSMGTPMDIHGYYTDGYLYAELMGQKIKQKLSLEEALSQAKTKGFDFPKEAVKSSEIKDVDGQTQLLITLDPEATKSIMAEYLQEAGAEGLGLTEDSIAISEASIDAKLDKDSNFINNNVKFKGSITIDTETADLDLDMKTEILSMGESVTVDLPQDLDTYIEATLPQ